MKQYTLNFHGSHTVTLKVSRYISTKKLALLMYYDGELLCKLTKNLDDSAVLRPDEQFVNTYDVPFAEQFICENKLGRPTGYVIVDGDREYPIYEFYGIKTRR